MDNDLQQIIRNAEEDLASLRETVFRLEEAVKKTGSSELSEQLVIETTNLHNLEEFILDITSNGFEHNDVDPNNPDLE